MSKIAKERAFLAAWQEAGEYAALSKIWNPRNILETLPRDIPQLPEEQHLYFPEDTEFPESLKHIPLPPLGIFVVGALPPPKSVCVTIVGTRRASPRGLRAAHDFAFVLGRAGCVIVSGLAFGVDAASHKGALDAGAKTIAVLASNPSEITPSSHHALARRIVEGGGAILSEFPPAHATQPYHFLQRNRIASGLSSATLLIEVPEGSGATATARFALEQNRDVFCLPGNYDDPLYFVNHQLLKQGALLATNPSDILEFMGLDGTESQPAYIPQNAQEEIIINLLKTAPQPLPVDKIAENGNLDVQSVIITLTQLTLSDAIQETPQGYKLR